MRVFDERILVESLAPSDNVHEILVTVDEWLVTDGDGAGIKQLGV